MNKKLIFLDIDGTLTSPGSNVPPDSALASDGSSVETEVVFMTLQSAFSGY